jgi:ribulose kinase
MVPGMWLTEGGQSATGALIDHVIRENASYPAICAGAAERGVTVYQYLNGIVAEIQKREKKGPEICRDITILPYHLGNRSPHADPRARGVVSGVTLDESIETAARMYYAAIQAVAYGTREIIDAMNRKGYDIRRIHACGGGTKNPLWLQEHADIAGCEIVLPKESEAVILGSAMLAAVGAGKYSTLLDAAAAMSSPGARYTPNRKTRSFHESKYNVIQKMYKDQLEYRDIMDRQ